MKVTSLGLPTVEDIKGMPCFKRKGKKYYLLANEASSKMTTGLYSFINEDGAINITGASPSGLERYMITLEKENDEEIIPGELIEYDGIVFEVTAPDKAISLQDIIVGDVLFGKRYLTMNPNIGDDYPIGYVLRKDLLKVMWETSNRTATVLDIPKYESKEHEEVEKDLFTDVIKLTYYLRKKNAEERHDSYGAEIYTLTDEKLAKELETPNLFVLSMFNFFASTVPRDQLDESSAIMNVLKANKLLNFSEDLDTISPERLTELKEVIETIKPIYDKAVKYSELNSQYAEYKKNVIFNRESKTRK